jgi:hypothetical protein
LVFFFFIASEALASFSLAIARDAIDARDAPRPRGGEGGGVEANGPTLRDATFASVDSMPRAAK